MPHRQGGHRSRPGASVPLRKTIKPEFGKPERSVIHLLDPLPYEEEPEEEPEQEVIESDSESEDTPEEEDDAKGDGTQGSLF